MSKKFKKGLLAEIADTTMDQPENNVDDIHGSGETRGTKSDASIVALVDDIFQILLGLSVDTSERIVRMIKSSDEYTNMKHKLKSLHNIEFRKLIAVVDAAGNTNHNEVDSDLENEDNTPVNVKTSLKDKMNSKPEEHSSTFESSFPLLSAVALDELDSFSYAKYIGQDKPTRIEKAKMSDVNYRKDLIGDMDRLSASNDPDERKLAMLLKQVATLRKKIQSKEGAGANQQPDNTNKV